MKKEIKSEVNIRRSGGGFLIEITNTPIDQMFAVTKNQKCICDESGLNEETRADIGHFKKCPQANIPNQIIEEGLKEFEEKFPSHISMNNGSFSSNSFNPSSMI